jgi:hypothetical protein
MHRWRVPDRLHPDAARAVGRQLRLLSAVSGLALRRSREEAPFRDVMRPQASKRIARDWPHDRPVMSLATASAHGMKKAQNCSTLFGRPLELVTTLSAFVECAVGARSIQVSGAGPSSPLASAGLAASAAANPGRILLAALGGPRWTSLADHGS